MEINIKFCKNCDEYMPATEFLNENATNCEDCILHPGVNGLQTECPVCTNCNKQCALTMFMKGKKLLKQCEKCRNSTATRKAEESQLPWKTAYFYALVV